MKYINKINEYDDENSLKPYNYYQALNICLQQRLKELRTKKPHQKKYFNSLSQNAKKQ